MIDPKFTVLIIKPVSVGRGDAPAILHDILHNTPVALRGFRVWRICDTSWKALCLNSSSLDYNTEKLNAGRSVPAWICLLTHLDRVTDPVPVLEKYCGPFDSDQWLPKHLRYRYSHHAHDIDTVVHISGIERAEYEASILFEKFNKEDI